MIWRDESPEREQGARNPGNPESEAENGLQAMSFPAAGNGSARKGV
jgi:hypothetical protein